MSTSCVSAVAVDPSPKATDAAVVGGDVGVVRLHGAVADHRLAEGRVVDLREVALALVQGDVAVAAVDQRAVAQQGVLGLDVGGVALAEAWRRRRSSRR